MTMHRDLDDLAERRLLRKLRGKVEAYPALTIATAARFRDTLHHGEKDALGEAAANHVQPGQNVCVDDSTTLLPLVKRLAETDALTAGTNSLHAARLLGPKNDVVLAGGRYSPEYDTCAGPELLNLL